MVYRPVLPRRSLPNLFARRRTGLRGRGETGKNRTHRNSLPDRQRHFDRDHQARGASSLAAGDYSVASGSQRIAVANSDWMDSIVKQGTSKLRRKSQLKQKPPAVKPPLAKRGQDFPQTPEDQSAKLRLRIEAVIRSIPRGKVSTYGAVARAAGLPRGARLVARILHRGFGLPWQRVLGAGGEIKLRGDHAIEQRLRLEAEGVRFRGRKVDMKQCEFKFGRSGVVRRKP